MRKLLMVGMLLSLCACQAPKTCEVEQSPIKETKSDPFWWEKVDRHAIKDKMVVYHPEEDYLAP